MWSLVSVGQQGPPDNRGFGNIQAFIPIAAAIIILLIAVIVILLFPRLRNVKVSKPIEPKVHEVEASVTDLQDKTAVESPLDVTIKLLHDDERRVVEALAKSGGSKLQKDISYELKLSRVKTHRVLVGLIERGIVKAEKHYNTNMITLSAWLMGGKSEEKLGDKSGNNN